MNRVLAEVKESGKILWRNMQESHGGVIFHLLIAALHGVCPCLGRIGKLLGVQKTAAMRLAVGQQDMDALAAKYRQIDLELNAKKTKIMIMSPSKAQPDLSILLEGKEIEKRRR